MWATLTIRERIITIRIRTTTRPLSRHCQVIRMPSSKLSIPGALWEVDLHLKRTQQAHSDSFMHSSPPTVIRDHIRRFRYHPKMAGPDTELARRPRTAGNRNLRIAVVRVRRISLLLLIQGIRAGVPGMQKCKQPIVVDDDKHSVSILAKLIRILISDLIQ